MPSLRQIKARVHRWARLEKYHDFIEHMQKNIEREDIHIDWVDEKGRAYYNPLCFGNYDVQVIDSWSFNGEFILKAKKVRDDRSDDPEDAVVFAGEQMDMASLFGFVTVVTRLRETKPTVRLTEGNLDIHVSTSTHALVEQVPDELDNDNNVFLGIFVGTDLDCNIVYHKNSEPGALGKIIAMESNGEWVYPDADDELAERFKSGVSVSR